MNNLTLRQWIQNFEESKYYSKDREIQVEAGWYDWFCKDTSLAHKTRILGKKVIQISKSSKINLDTMYVFFKNNCPMNGSLYDDFRICDLETGDVIYTITPSEGYTRTKGQASVWGKENDFKESLVQGTWKDVKKFFDI